MDYKEIGHAIQIEQDRAHVDPSVIDVTSYDLAFENGTISRQEGIDLFNDVAEENGLRPLPDPSGYMKLDGNIYDKVHDAYEQEYQLFADRIDSQMMTGGSHALYAVLDNLNKNVRHDMKDVMRPGVNYSDLRFMKSNPDLDNAITEFATTRVKITYLNSIRRSVEEQNLETVRDSFDEQKKSLSALIFDPPAPKEATFSIDKLVENGGQAGLDGFVEMLNKPEGITKSKWDEHPIATAKATDRETAMFIIKNRKYLEEFNFKISKQSGTAVMEWQSPKVDKMYEEMDAVLEMGSLDDAPDQGQSI